MIIDGKDDKSYDNIGTGSLAFSQNGKSLAYAAESGNKWCVVVDGETTGQTV